MDEEGKRVRRATRFIGDFSAFAGDNSSDDEGNEDAGAKKGKVRLQRQKLFI